MAKKRKISNHHSKEPRPLDVQDGKLGRIHTYEDVADSEDEFHINRNKILLDDGPNAKRRKRWEEEGMWYLMAGPIIY
jgi:U3 small nucleolar RNA-associated protein 3